MHDGSEADPKTASGSYVWPSLAISMIVVYLLTNNSIVSSVIPSLLSALPLLRTGYWIFRHDPNRKRRSVCCAFYISAAFFQLACVALVSIFMLGTLENRLGKPADMSRVLAYVATVIVGVSLTAILGSIEVFWAYRWRIRVFVHPRLIDWCNQDFQRISSLTLARPRFNYASFVLAVSLQLPGLVAGTVLMILLTATGKPMDTATFMISITIMVLFFLILPMLMIAVQMLVSETIVAQHPSECWSRESVETTCN